MQSHRTALDDTERVQLQVDIQKLLIVTYVQLAARVQPEARARVCTPMTKTRVCKKDSFQHRPIFFPRHPK